MSSLTWADQLSGDDWAYEQDLLRNPYSLKNWWYYLEYKEDAPDKVRYTIYERAVRLLPRSYKLWYRYLTERKKRTSRKMPGDPAYMEANHAFERAMVFMAKMPVIWKEYLTFLTDQYCFTYTRKAFDQALRSLPVTQHRMIWPLYLKFVKTANVPETAMRVWRRYLKIEPTTVEEFVDYLVKAGHYDEAARQLGVCLNDEHFTSEKGKSKHDLWSELLELITKNPDKVPSMNVEAIIRGGLRRFPHEVGRLWNALADYYIRLGHFEKARDIYEEGLATVNTVRDFSLVFDAYAQYEESMLNAKMGALEDEEEDDDDDSDSDADDVDVDLRLARLEDLMSRRPLMLSSVLLRQNPHNVAEWHKRVGLMGDDAAKIVLTYSDAVTTVDPMKATGKPHTLWSRFAGFYEKNDDIAGARQVFEKATQVNYKSVDDLASVWCAWAEMELRNRNYDEALATLKRAAVVPRGHQGSWGKKNQRGPVQKRLYKSTRLWTFLADLEENLGSLESCKAVYEKMIDVKVVTPQIILNYASLLEERKYFEDSFRVFEKGIALFEFPHVLPIWSAYLTKFIGRYEGNKIERGRDLFEQAVSKVPANDAKKLYLLYAKFEEKYGLARRAMAVYARGCRAVPPEQRLEMYTLYVTRATELFGVTKTREIYGDAMNNLPNGKVGELALKYAHLERRLGEIDRARAIFSYGGQYCNPKVHTAFWKNWHDFEVQHGNRDTFKEMLRIRRSVAQQFAQTSFMSGTNALPGMRKAGTIAGSNKRKRDMDPMERLEAEQQEQQADSKESSEFAAAVAAKAQQAADASQADEKKAPGPAANPEEIALDDDSDDDDEDTEMASESKVSGVGISQKPVPTAVFGAALGQT